MSTPDLARRTPADGLRWTHHGTRLILDAITTLDQTDHAAASGLPGWTRKHLIGHVAANADALGNLVHWAATGERTPMYASPEARAAGIATAAEMSAAALDRWVSTSAETLAAAMDRLTEEQWTREILTAQGRTVPATEISWMRAREVYVHAVDLAVPKEDGGVTFADLPDDFLTALCADITAKRGLTTLPADVAGAPLPELTAWLAGRPHAIDAAPELGPWL